MLLNPFESPEKGTDSWARLLLLNLVRAMDEYRAAYQVALEGGEAEDARAANNVRDYLETGVGDVSLAEKQIPESYARKCAEALNKPRSLLGSSPRLAVANTPDPPPPGGYAV